MKASDGQSGAAWGHHLDGVRPGLAMTLGPDGPGDAARLSARGWEAVVVIPPRSDPGSTGPAGGGVLHMTDQVPELRRVRAVGYRFDLIVVSRDWQQLVPTQRPRLFRILSELLSPGGRLILRCGFWPADSAGGAGVGERPPALGELEGLARDRALVLEDYRRHDRHSGTAADYAVLQLPDDGSGGLALLRHIVINDNKSATYKLGLLRVMSRIAESFPGAVITRDDDWVTVPFGLIGLLWLKLYKPLIIDHRLPQLPAANPAFAKAAFFALGGISDPDWHVGAELDADRAPALIQALRDACTVIQHMPAHFITYPGSDRRIFEVCRRPARRRSGPLRLDRAFFSAFGEVRVPAHLWQTLGQYACWLQPALVNEWLLLMRGWVKDAALRERIRPELFRWEEQTHFTGIARERLATLRQSGRAFPCTWTGRPSRRIDIDHAFPWSRWPSNDLWNLLPASATVNRRKSDRLPTVAAFDAARSRIVDWWEEAFVTAGMGERFFEEARLALPTLREGRVAPDTVFDAMLHQRARIKRDQQLPDWSP